MRHANRAACIICIPRVLRGQSVSSVVRDIDQPIYRPIKIHFPPDRRLRNLVVFACISLYDHFESCDGTLCVGTTTGLVINQNAVNHSVNVPVPFHPTIRKRPQLTFSGKVLGSYIWVDFQVVCCIWWTKPSEFAIWSILNRKLLECQSYVSWCTSFSVLLATESL